MAKVKTLKIQETDRETRKLLISFDIDIKVNTQGQFYATLPDDIYDRLTAINMLPVEFKPEGNGYSKIRGTAFTKSMTELETLIRNAIKPLVEFKQISNTIVIKYLVNSACEYVKTTDGRYFPHPVQHDDTLEFNKDKNGDIIRYSGIEERHATKVGPYMLSLTILFRRKITNEYADGSQKTYYNYVQEKELGENGAWLRSLIGMGNLGWSSSIALEKMSEIEYTEQTALFFRQFITGIFKINDYIRHLNNAEILKEIMSNSKALNPFNEK